MKTNQEIREYMKKNAKENGYFLCADQELLRTLIDGLAANEKRYGYESCPCRLSSGVKQYDVDIICPCEYRDADVDEYGMCYCGLFVNQELKLDPSKMTPIPERRPVEVQDAALSASKKTHKVSSSSNLNSQMKKSSSSISLWRCTVCGYLCARELPPPLCPICNAKAERFERFRIQDI